MSGDSQWQPIETAPKNTEVLICGRAYGKPYYAVAKFDDGIWWQFDPLGDGYTIESGGHSYWMPIQPIPQD